jgi:hypothetical protein
MVVFYIMCSSFVNSIVKTLQWNLMNSAIWPISNNLNLVGHMSGARDLFLNNWGLKGQIPQRGRPGGDAEVWNWLHMYRERCTWLYICEYSSVTGWPLYTGWPKKSLPCLIYFIRALYSVLSNLNFDIRPVHFRAILTERAAFKLE